MSPPTRPDRKVVDVDDPLIIYPPGVTTTQAEQRVHSEAEVLGSISPAHRKAGGQIAFEIVENCDQLARDTLLRKIQRDKDPAKIYRA